MAGKLSGVSIPAFRNRLFLRALRRSFLSRKYNTAVTARTAATTKPTMSPIILELLALATYSPIVFCLVAVMISQCFPSNPSSQMHPACLLKKRKREEKAPLIDSHDAAFGFESYSIPEPLFGLHFPP